MQTIAHSFASTVRGCVPKTIGAKQVQIVFTKEFQEPCNVTPTQPITTPGRHAFEVVMPIKEGHTAFGWCAHPPRQAYMTPDFEDPAQSNYVSMGGAGFIYPLRKPTPGQYTAGDVVRAEVELSEQGTGVARWYVNGVAVGEVPWEHGLPLAVYPSVSCKSGHVECNMTFD